LVSYNSFRGSAWRADYNLAGTESRTDGSHHDSGIFCPLAGQGLYTPHTTATPFRTFSIVSTR